jgi:2-dehydro-3-deoxy-D-arabinonate dehydratase
MTTVRTIAFRDPGSHRHLGVVDDDGTVIDLGTEELGAWIRRARDAGVPVTRMLADAVARRQADGPPATRLLLDERAAAVAGDREPMALDVPVQAPEVWAAGVTYRRSREARQAETAETTRDCYARVYEADRPELFLKDAAGRRTAPSGGAIRVRSDSRWTVPEPELGLVLDSTGAIVGYTVVDDVSARDIEGENPLYLPQAKIYRGSCAIGPAVLLSDAPMGAFAVLLRIIDPDGAAAFEGSTSTSELVRSLESLAAALLHDNVIDDGTVLSTGTGIVPPDGFTLLPGHRVECEIGGIGTLWNVVAGNAP